MPLRDDDTIREKIGSMQSDVRHVSNQVEKIADKLDEANVNIIQLRTSTVKQEECTKRTKFIAEKIDQLKDEVSKKQTRPENPVLRFGIEGVESGQGKRKRDPSRAYKSITGRIKDNVGVILAIITLVGVIIAGVVKFAHVIVTIEETLKLNKEKEEKNASKLQSEIVKLRKDQKKVIYVPVYATKDSGSEEQPPRRRRRRHPR